jgi:phenylpropionate dioxygenase-like ring-hydroxylating dioxygenase large terminal subunit
MTSDMDTQRGNADSSPSWTPQPPAAQETSPGAERVAKVGSKSTPSMRPRDCSYNDEDWRILSRQWFPIAAAASLNSTPLAVTLLDVDLVVYRLGSSIKVALDRCPHRGVPLSMGCIEGDTLVCAYHGLHYGPDGRCQKIPSQPDAKPSSRFRLAMLPSIERYGLIWTCLDGQEGEARIPPFPNWDRPDVQSILLPSVDIAASAGRQLEGFLDVAHFAWVHRETFANRDDCVVPQYETRSTEYGLQSEYWSTVSNYPRAQRHLEPNGFRWLRLFDVYPPFAAMLTVHFPNEGRLWILNLASPISARRTRLFVPWARNFDIGGSIDDVYAFNAKIFAEDQTIVERQTPQELPLQIEAELHIAADRSSVAYRRLLREMGLTFAPTPNSA